MKSLYVVILAAGQDTRMKSKLYKVLHPVMGKPMVEHVLEQVEELQPQKIVTVVGHGAELVQETLGERSEYVLQEQQLGTGHAVLCAETLLGELDGTTLVICGDTPLLTKETLERLIQHHEQTQAKATILTAEAEQPFGYGRIIRKQDGSVEKIVEQKDATKEEQAEKEINTGTYCFDNRALFDTLQKVGNDNAQGEYYLPDVIGILTAENERVSAYVMTEFEESLGVNDRVALAEANRIMKERINRQHMLNGVTIVDPMQTYIEADVQIGQDTIIEPGVLLKGKTIVGQDCYIGAHSEIIDSELADQVTIRSSHLEKAVLMSQSDVGPFGRLRPGTQLHEHVHVGNFVEIKNAVIGEATKVGHLTYVGDAVLGKEINVGCGTVFVNYDGKNKFQSKVGDHSFIGCNVNLVAPVELGKNSFIAAGSTVTQDVPEDAMAIARAKQTNKEGYARKLPHLS